MSTKKSYLIQTMSICQRKVDRRKINYCIGVYPQNNHKGKNGFMLMKIDMKKAYDKLEWEFMDKALGAWGFSKEFRRLIFSCLSLVN